MVVVYSYDVGLDKSKPVTLLLLLELHVSVPYNNKQYTRAGKIDFGGA